MRESHSVVIMTGAWPGRNGSVEKDNDYNRFAIPVNGAPELWKKVSAGDPIRLEAVRR